MPRKNTSHTKKLEGVVPEEKQKCFAIMPIGDQGETSAEHFKRVYEDIIVPACEYAGLEAHRADRDEGTHLIQLKILKSIIDAPICICDLSCLNPNVMFELGIRQAFDLPVVLIKDNSTREVFDIAGLRYYEYDKTLRYKDVVDFQTKLAKAISATLKQDNEKVSSSIISLLKIDSAQFDTTKAIGSDELLRLLLSEVGDLKVKIAKSVEPATPNVSVSQSARKRAKLEQKQLDFEKVCELAQRISGVLAFGDPVDAADDCQEFKTICAQYPNSRMFKAEFKNLLGLIPSD